MRANNTIPNLTEPNSPFSPSAVAEALAFGAFFSPSASENNFQTDFKRKNPLSNVDLYFIENEANTLCNSFANDNKRKLNESKYLKTESGSMVATILHRQFLISALK